ncbi:dna replication licensing factor mcm family member [Holotrichia oblita]|uniref:Dna replication licensing factor mcm family member n=1 Tax=Holotrichia oblita TaxID=644536 RepID=A0ACB9TNG7_HOLOL|nr:dna replication licensing factor mcm family member [Holotrichia oblita]
MSSPAGSRTPRRSGRNTPSRPDETPRREVIPETPTNTPGRGRRGGSSQNTNSDVATPMRWAQRNGEHAGTSSPPTVVPTSPAAALGMSEIDLSSPLNYGTPSSLGSVRTPRSGIRGTPIRLRPDVRSDKRIRQVNVGSDALEAIPESQESDGTAAHLVIWGTNVSVAQCKEKFKQFILRYIDPEAEDDERTEAINLNEPLYLQKLEEIHTLEEPFLNVNCNHLETFDEDIDQLITICGMVIRTSNIIPEMREAFFKCIVCSFTTVVEIDRGRITEPTLCTNCNTNHCFTLIHNRSQFTDKQLVKLQESPALGMSEIDQVLLNYGTPSSLGSVRTPRSGIRGTPIRLRPDVRSDKRISANIDQLITICGMVIRTSNIIPEMREAFSKCIVCSFTTVVEIDRGRITEPTLCTNCNTNHCFTLIHNRSQFTDKQLVKLQESPELLFRLRSSYDFHKEIRALFDKKDHCFPPERVELLQILAQKPDIYDRLARAIAPSIYENEDIKKGILLQLFGGTKKTFVTSGRTNFRAEINILLCGDPGTSKSQLLQYVYNLVPRSQYTSGKGSSAVGLTAYVTKDTETRQLVLQTGALVLADNGICSIDEFDKMNDSTRSVLHEVMEQQTLSIAKAGIICQLNARTSILAAANPNESQWNKNKTIIENVQLPHTLLSRFDLIFLILDPQNELFDKRLAKHLVSLYYRTREQEEDEILDMSILRDYIAYAKEHIHPKLGEEASQRLIQAYVDMRKVGSGRGQISAYPRQLESLIRLAEAHAKVRFSQTVTVDDVEEAYRLHREALKQSATDPLSGKIDVGILTTGLSSAARKRRVELAQSVKKLIEAKGKVPTINYQKLFTEVKEGSNLMVTREQFEDALKDLQDDGLIVVMGKASIRICSYKD